MTPRRKDRKMVDRSKRVFAGPAYETFEEAFPNVKSIRFEYTIYTGAGPTKGPYVMTTENFVPVVMCPNRLCREGGFEIDSELSLNVFFKKLRHHEGWIHCLGYEPMGGRSRRRCLCAIEYKVDVEYKENKE